MVQQRIERHESLEIYQQEKVMAREMTEELINLRKLIRSQETADIIVFDGQYDEIKGEYLAEISNISEEFKQKVEKVSQLKVLTNKRIRAAEKFKQELIDIGYIPEALNDFYELLLDFLDNDISTWTEILTYYSENYSIENEQTTGNASIDELYLRNRNFYQEVQDFQAEVYSEYDLESLL